MSKMAPGLALLGAGSFAQKQYLPVLSAKLSHLVSLKALWSRSKESAEAAALLIKDKFPHVEAKWGNEGLEDILKDEGIQGVAVALAPQVQWEYVIQALKAGKHVIQEKPVALSIHDAEQFLLEYKSLKAEKQIWAIAENYRFESGLLEAARLVKEIGEMVAVQVVVESPMNSSRPSFFSVWRRNIQGGYILDGGVHFIAGLRMLTGCEVKSVVSITRHLDQALPPPDNMSALVELNNGCAGVLVISFSCVSKKMSWRVVGTKGTVEVEQAVSSGQQGFMVTHYKDTGEVAQSFYPNNGVEHELTSFVRDMDSLDEADKRSSATEACRDVAVIEAMLESNGKLIEVRNEF